MVRGGAGVAIGAAVPTTEDVVKGEVGTEATIEIGGNSGGDQTDADLIRAEFDLIVVGGGYSGTACAISAARNGVEVALVHERSMLGGNASSEVRLYPEGNDEYQPWIKESGIHEEIHVEERVRNHVVL